ncbi:MAG: glycosyltransferase family 39 protein [Kouleothrix sp.]|nr:glycosyltransferase family 39 protein [Kouleothrix sp.]
MGREPTTYSNGHQGRASAADSAPPAASFSRRALPYLAGLLAAAALGALLLALVYQIPVTHTVNIGGYDSAYVQGFYDPERGDPSGDRPELAGSDGSARWTRASSYLLFPQAGLPAEVTLRLRGWRLSGAAPRVTVLLNGGHVLGQIQAGPDWQDYRFTIDGGLLKPNDVVIEIRSETARIDAGDPRALGVLLDRATYHAGPAPIVPYPPQLAYGALAAGLLYLLLVRPKETRRRADKETRRQEFLLLVSRSPGLLVWLSGLLLLAIAFLALYRAQLPYPYPLLRLLPAVDAILAAALALRHGPALARRAPALLDGLALGGMGAWLAAVLLAARQHVTLSTPGAEADFRVFALRSAHLSGQFPAGTTSPQLDGVLRADGFYNLGYPLLLWLARPLAADNPFLAARLIAALAGAVLLAATWWLARRMLGRPAALLALAVLALSPLVVEQSLYVGTDMPFAALCALALALILWATSQEPGVRGQGPGAGGAVPVSSLRSPVSRGSFVALAGLAAGAAFLIRHPGLLLLPLGWLAIWRSSELRVMSYELQSSENSKLKTQNSKLKTAHLLVFTLAFGLTILPQVAVNLRDSGSPLYSQQAKNVWQATFGAGDWGRWSETANDISVGQVVAQDPGRFLTNWWANVRGYLGTGGEDTREFGQAVQLRLLGFPANWLAVAGLIGWAILALKPIRPGDQETRRPGDQETRRPGDQEQLEIDRPFVRSAACPFAPSLLLVWVALYVVSISVGLALQPRFALPLAPVYAVAAAWLVCRIRPSGDESLGQRTRDLGFAGSGEAGTSSPKPQAPSPKPQGSRTSLPLLIGMVLLALLWGGFAVGAGYVLRARPADEAALARAEGRPELPGQPADEVGAIQLVQATVRPGERLIVRAEPAAPIGKYSAIAHLALSAPPSDDPAALRATGAQYLLWSAALGQAPTVGPAIGAAGIYTLYRIER